MYEEYLSLYMQAYDAYHSTSDNETCNYYRKLMNKYLLLMTGA